jgi:hypothetical protein
MRNADGETANREICIDDKSLPAWLCVAQPAPQQRVATVKNFTRHGKKEYSFYQPAKPIKH